MAGKSRPTEHARGLWAIAIIVAAMAGVAQAGDGPEQADRMAALENQVRLLTNEVASIRQQRQDDRARQDRVQVKVDQLRQEVADADDAWLDFAASWENLHLGGYGEMHANFSEGDSPDTFDIHRMVLYMGYDLADWIKLHSEVELEHAFASNDSGGELLIEQLYLDFEFADCFNVRAGRILTPLGIVNHTHEPTTFNGVERPTFAKYIIPSTWSSDGVGIYGQLAPWVNYQFYVVAGLDGSMFNAKDGLRKGRLKERPSFHDIAVTGRLDFFPLVGRDLPCDQDLRIGLSGYYGGTDNANKGMREHIPETQTSASEPV